ncbi:hypothetical protein [Chlorogloea sp. CCALA 695]|uniref:hypothetical protein n=1 Tax=Chlorogloea sp. CCALA 695 TaxID=2107693 RepID=UPI002685D5D1
MSSGQTKQNPCLSVLFPTDVKLKTSPSSLSNNSAVGTPDKPMTVTRILLAFPFVTVTAVIPSVGLSWRNALLS